MVEGNENNRAALHWNHPEWGLQAWDEKGCPSVNISVNVSLLCAQTQVTEALVRPGGDEFPVVMRHMSSMEEAHKKETAIRRTYYESRYVDPDSAVRTSAFYGRG